MQTKSGADEAMYGYTVSQFMTRTVITVKRQTTMRELAALFEIVLATTLRNRNPSPRTLAGAFRT